MKQRYYCSECGKLLAVYKKAVKGNIITLIDPHECLEEPIDINLEQKEIPEFVKGERGKFVQKLNDLSPRSVAEGLEGTLRDRRPVEHIKSSAPESVIQTLQSMQNTSPERDMRDIDEEVE